MLVLDNGDKIRGDASVASVVDYTLHGLAGSELSQLADGQLADSTGDLYTAGAIVVVSSVVLVNTHNAALTLNLFLLPSGGTARRILSKDFTLSVGYSLHYDGVKVFVLSPTGAIVSSYVVHAASHTNGTDDVQDATDAQKGLATAAQITKLDGIEASATKYPDTGEQAFLDADHSKLDGIDTGAKDDQTGAEIKALYEVEANAFTDTKNTKLSGIEEAANVTDAVNVAGSIHGVAAKATPVDADEIAGIDTEATNVLKKHTWTNIKAFLKTYFDSLYQAVNTAILKATFTTKGDILVTTGASTSVRLGVGTNTHVLTADSTEASGVKWAAAGGGDVSAAANLGDHKLVRGDGGAKGVQESTVVVSDDGEMTNPSQPAFNAYINTSQNNVSGDGTVYNVIGAFFTEVFDQGNNVSNGTFTAPITGKYLLSIGIQLQGIGAGHTYLDIKIITSNKNYFVTELDALGIDVGSGLILAGTILTDMDINDTAYLLLQVSGTGKTVDVMLTNTFFAGALIC